MGQWRHGGTRYLQQPSGSMQVRQAIDIAVFRFAEIRQHVLPAPAGGPHRRPVVVIGGQATNVHHAVNSAGTAQGLAAWPVNILFAGVNLRLSRKTPVNGGMPQRHGLRRVMNGRHIVAWPGFQQQDL